MFPVKNTRIGRMGERLALKFIKKILDGGKVMQLDWLCMYRGQVIIFEIKTQEKYNNPDGHGLPAYQIQSRLELKKLFEGSARLFLVVICLSDICIYSLEIKDNWQQLGFYSKNKRRFIFNIEHFKKHDILVPDINKIVEDYRQ